MSNVEVYRDKTGAAVGKMSSPSSSNKKGKLTSFRVEISDNGGFIVECCHEGEKISDGYPKYTPPVKSVFEDKKALDTYIDSLLGYKD